MQLGWGASVMSHAVTIRAGFPVEKASWIGTMENCIDAIFALDIFYNFRTAYVDEQVGC